MEGYGLLPFKSFKAVFHKFYLVHSWILCPKYGLLYIFAKTFNHSVISKKSRNFGKFEFSFLLFHKCHAIHMFSFNWKNVGIIVYLNCIKERISNERSCPRVFCKMFLKRFSEKFRKTHRKTLVPESFSW